MLASITPANAVEPTDEANFKRLVAEFTETIGTGRPMEQVCTDLSESDIEPAELKYILKPYFIRQKEKGLNRHKIQDCRYELEGKKGRVIMMNPSPEQLAHWIVSACNDADVRPLHMKKKSCMVIVARMIWLQANAQFPITGTVAEPGCDGAAGLFGFRHGVTVGLEGMPPTELLTNPEKCQGSVAPACSQNVPENLLVGLLWAKVTKLGPRAYARLSNLSRKQWAGGEPTGCPGKDADPTWITISRDEYLRAIGEARYPMLEDWLRRGAIENRFKCGKFDQSGFLRVNPKETATRENGRLCWEDEDSNSVVCCDTDG